MAKSVYTVTQVNAYIKNMFTQDYMLQSVFVKGEISGCKYHSSGHIYFTLKDQKAVIACVMFARDRYNLDFTLKDGMQVVIGGSVDVFERDGKYQLYAKQVVRDGTGLLHERFEQLKRELAERGMFASQYKQPLPKFIKTLGIVTADTGAAVRDIIQIATRRNPYVQIILYPAIVQGEQASASIVKGIRALEAMGVDVMIVGRGGGSIEDLWAFNEEIVAQAIFDCRIPIISAVGHETDTTIADYVADLRAPTPSAAAELAVYDVRLFLSQLEGYADILGRDLKRVVTARRNKLEKYESMLRYLNPENRIREKRTYLLKLEDRLEELMQTALQRNRHQLAIYIERLKGASPLSRLNSGYSYVSDENGKNIKSVEGLSPGQSLTIQVTDGKVYADVTGISKE